MSLSYPRLRRRRRGWWKGEEPTPGNIFVPRLRFLHVAFEPPPRNLELGSNLQLWRLKVRKSAPGSNPFFKLELYNSGIKRGTLIPETNISSKSGVLIEVGWNAALLPSQSGAEVEGYILSYSTQMGVEMDIAAFEWVPTLVPE